MSYYAGLDLHKSMSVIVVKDEQGEKVREGRVDNDPVQLAEFFEPLHKQPVKVALEATTHYAWMYDTLEAFGCEVELAHPLKVRAIASARIKTDRIDANVLCDLLRGNLLPTSYVPPHSIRELRELLRHRIRVVRNRTQVKNRLTVILAKVNQRPFGTDTFGKKGRKLLAELALPSILAWQRDDGLEQLEFFDKQIARIDSKIKESAKDYPAVKQLMEIPGVGIFTALLILAEIGDIKRFSTPKQLVSYAGIAPGVYQSGNTCHGRGITHQGSRYLRWILVEAAQHPIRKPGPLRTFYLRLRNKKGHNKALVAVARKMLVGIFYVLRDSASFAPSQSLPNSRAARTRD